MLPPTRVPDLMNTLNNSQKGGKRTPNPSHDLTRPDDPSDEIRLTNYISRNPIIKLLMNNFMQRIGRFLKDIDAHHASGLDAGCGEGHLLAYLYEQKLVGEMVAVDLDQRKLDYASRHYPYCQYVRGNIQQLELDDNLFDFVMSTEVFEHLPDPARALQELRRVAKPGAHLIISVPFEPFFHWGNILRGKYWYRGGRTPDHLHFWHRHEFRAFLAPHVHITSSYCISTFPWLVHLGRFR